MLVLSRKTQQTIVIDGRIEVTVLAVSGGTVRLGVNAPREVAVHRTEILDRLNAQASRDPDAAAGASMAPSPCAA